MHLTTTTLILHLNPANKIPDVLCDHLVQQMELNLTLLIGYATGKKITRSTRTTGAIAEPTANPNLEQIA
jgi:hypothetical protein